MITDAFVAKLAALLSIAGFCILFFSQELPNEKTIAEALREKNNSQLTITANVSWVKAVGNAVFFELNDGNKMSAVFFNPTIEQAALLSKGKKILATGTIEKNKKATRLVASEVKSLD